MHKHDDVFIAGRWMPAHSPTRYWVTNPATEQVWALVPDGDEVDVDRAVVAARAAFPAWAASTAPERGAVLPRLATEIETRSAELTRLITTENGTAVSGSGATPAHGAAHLRLTAVMT